MMPLCSIELLKLPSTMLTKQRLLGKQSQARVKALAGKLGYRQSDRTVLRLVVYCSEPAGDASGCAARPVRRSLHITYPEQELPLHRRFG